MSPLCELLGITRQGYYKHVDKVSEECILITSIVLYCQHIRAPDNLPKAGCRELLELNRQYFGEKFTLGRDRFYDVLRANGFMLRNKRYRPRTTDSNHNNRIYPDLLNTTPKLVAKRPGELVVADITYVYCSEGFGYLSLLTDAYTRYIVGYCFFESLETEGPLQALYMACECFESFGVSIVDMIHHSDRGVQYTSAAYVKVLKLYKMRISMTQTGDPLHNALAERMNNTVKNSWLFNNGELDFITAGGSIDNAIRMYNTARPHQALGMKTPYEMMTGHPNNPLLGFRIQENEENTGMHDDISEKVSTFAPPRNGGATANASAHL